MQEICDKAVWIIAKGSNVRPPNFDYLSVKFNSTKDSDVNHRQLFDEMVKWYNDYLQFPRVQKASAPGIKYSNSEIFMPKIGNFAITFGEREGVRLMFTPQEACFLQLGGMAAIEDQSGNAISCQEVTCRAIMNAAGNFRHMLLTPFFIVRIFKKKLLKSDKVQKYL